MFDAYNIKKVLPRLVVAVILIQLSWFIFTAMIRLTAVFAYGLEGLMYAPFGGRNAISFSSIVSNSDVAGGNELFVTAVIAAGAAAGFLGVVFSFALTALIGLLVGFATLLVRQVVLVTLLVISPLALVAWILPGTQKFWKLWWESFSKLLLMFPMIVTLVAGGRIVAYITAQASGAEPSTDNLFSNNLIGDVTFLAIITIGYFGPFFLIPKTFQLAGSAFGNITGMVNDRSRGVFDRLRKGRQAKASDNWRRSQINQRVNARKYEPGTRKRWLADKVNSVASIATSNPWDTARIYGKTAGGKALLSEIEGEKHKQTHALSQEMQKRGITVDQAFRALSGTHKKLRQNGLGPLRTQKDIDKAVGILSTSDSANDRVAASQLQAAGGFLANAYRSEEFGRGSIEGAALLGLASQGFADRKDIVDVTQAMGGGQSAMTIGNDAAFASYKGGRIDMKPTYGPMWSPAANGGKGGFIEEANEKQQEALVKTAKQYEWTSAKGAAIDELAPAFARVASEKDVTGNFTQEAVATQQTIAQNANSAADPGAKARWRMLASEVFGMNPNNPNFDALIYQKATGFQGRDGAADATGAPAGGKPPGAPPSR